MLSDVVLLVYTAVFVVGAIYWAYERGRLRRLDEIDRKDIERKMGEGNLRGALEALMRIEKRHHGK